jgi:Flp pilus assembly protein TadG
MMRSASARALKEDRRGTTAVEFALVAPPLLTMIVGVLALGIAYFQGATLQRAMERTLRTAMVHPEMEADDIEALLAQELERIGSPDVNFTYEIDESGEVPLAVARAEYTVPLQIPFIPETSLRFEAENVMPAPEG